VTTAIESPAVREKHAARGYTHETRFDSEFGLIGRCGLRGRPPGVDWAGSTEPVDCSDCLAEGIFAGVLDALHQLKAQRQRPRDWSPWLVLGPMAHEHLVRSAKFAERRTFSQAAITGRPFEKLFGCKLDVSSEIDPYGWHILEPLADAVLAR
jgi:hypothetical protein